MLYVCIVFIPFISVYVYRDVMVPWLGSTLRSPITPPRVKEEKEEEEEAKYMSASYCG